MNLILAFVTGLTTGGLSCLAVQGGLLAGSLAQQIEKDIQVTAGPKKKARQAQGQPSRIQLASPILAFLIAKLAAYTALGFLLGLVGQMFQLSPYTRAALQIGIGIFMLGSALRMLNVHPIFRYFVFEPPAFLRRRLRKAAAGGAGASLAAPAFLGLLTVLIPCGITQAMMAAALGTGSPLQGAALMFAFTLGTSPVFFGVVYFATRLGAKLEKSFMRFAAAVLILLAVFTIDSGLTLAGSPLSLTRWAGGIFAPVSQIFTVPEKQELQVFAPADEQPSDGLSPLSQNSDGSVVTIQVRNTGYSPGVVHAKAGVPVQLRLVTDGVYSCSLAFVIPSLGVQQLLEPTGEAVIDIPAQAKGTKIPFSCSMGMYGGTILFDL